MLLLQCTFRAWSVAEPTGGRTAMAGLGRFSTRCRRTALAANCLPRLLMPVSAVNSAIQNLGLVSGSQVGELANLWGKYRCRGRQLGWQQDAR